MYHPWSNSLFSISFKFLYFCFLQLHTNCGQVSWYPPTLPCLRRIIFSSLLNIDILIYCPCPKSNGHTDNTLHALTNSHGHTSVYTSYWPQPTTPRPLIMVVWESVPTRLSGYSSPSSLNTTRARYSRFTWWTMPDPGGTISMFFRAVAPHWKIHRYVNS